MAGALRNLGVERAFIINSENGMDELSTASRSKVVYLEDGYITEYMLDPAKLGFKRTEISELKGGDADHNAALMKDILSGKIKGPIGRPMGPLALPGSFRLVPVLQRLNALLATG